MNKINVSLISASRVAMQECMDVIDDIPDFRVLVMPAELSVQSTWAGLANTDVLVIDESVIKQEGFAALQLLLDSYPQMKCLVIMNKYNENKMIWAMLRGVRGVMCAGEERRLLPKAIRHLHAGEVWMSRNLLKPFRQATRSRQEWPFTGAGKEGNWLKLH